MAASFLLTAVLAVVAACGSDAAAPPTPTAVPEVGSLGGGASDTLPAAANIDIPTGPIPGQVGSTAQEIQGISGWVNSEPFTMESLRGKVVLVDFWTYTCVNCIRTMPFLREWQEKYADEGLVIVGVHSPEFEFEEVRENVEAAVKEFQITWPVLQDNEMETWRAFNNQFWPAKYLIDKDGIIQYTHFGEGAYDETELEIRKWLRDAGSSIDGIAANPDPGPTFNEQASTGTIETTQTRELYAGLERNANSQVPYIIQAEFYAIPIGGPILLEDYAALKYFGTSVNVVLGSEGEPYRVYLEIDDGPIPLADWGTDIQEAEDGRTFIFVDQDRMYRLIESPEYGGHEMKLSSNSDEFAIFAFTFGSYTTGP